MSASVIRAIIILAIAIFVIVLVNKYRTKDIKKDLDKMVLYNAIKSKLIDIMSDKERFSLIPPTYEMFREYYMTSIYDEIATGIDKDGCKYLNCQKINIRKDKVDQYLQEELNSDLIQNMLVAYYSDYQSQIFDNIKQAENLESEAVKYHESFGKESSGDPILHPREPNNEDSTTDTEKYSSIDELISAGTAEDLEE